MSEISIAQAAERLGVNAQRARSLAAAGRIPARKLGRAWAIDSDRLSPDAVRPGSGRPLSAGNAWAMLALLAGELAPWVDPSVRSRLRRRAGSANQLLDSLRWSEPRSRNLRFRFLAADIERLAWEPDLVPAGLSAEDPAIDVRSRSDEFDAYLEAASLDRLLKQYCPIADPVEANVLLRIPSHRWILERGGRSPGPVVAADLLGSDDPRVRRAGEQALQALVA